MVWPSGWGKPDDWTAWPEGEPGAPLPPPSPPIVAPIGGFTERSIVPMVARIADHGPQTSALLVEQFKQSTRLHDLVLSYTDVVQELEDVLQDLLTLRMLENAEGAQLDGIGQIVDEPRAGRQDEAYRDAIALRIFINTADGTPRTIATFLKTITEATQVRYWELYPASVQLYTDGMKALPAARQNLLSWSEQFQQTVWQRASADTGLLVDSRPDPLGGQTADRFICATGPGVTINRVTQTLIDPLAVGTTYWWSVFAESIGDRHIEMRNPSGTPWTPLTSLAPIVKFFLSGAGSYQVVGPSVAEARIEHIGNGIYHCAMRGVPVSTSGTGGMQIDIMHANGAVAISGDGSNGVALWGAMISRGDELADYVRTTLPIATPVDIAQRVRNLLPVSLGPVAVIVSGGGVPFATEMAPQEGGGFGDIGLGPLLLDDDEALILDDAGELLVNDETLTEGAGQMTEVIQHA